MLQAEEQLRGDLGREAELRQSDGDPGAGLQAAGLQLSSIAWYEGTLSEPFIVSCIFMFQE